MIPLFNTSSADLSVACESGNVVHGNAMGKGPSHWIHQSRDEIIIRCVDQVAHRSHGASHSLSHTKIQPRSQAIQPDDPWLHALGGVDLM